MRSALLPATTWIVLALAPDAHAQDAARQPKGEAAVGYLFHPEGPGSLKLRFAAGAQMDILPTRVVENQIRQVPMITGNVRLGLPYGFSADLRAAAVIITNEAELGVAWTYGVHDLSFGLVNHIGGWYGFLGTQGFDASGFGSLEQPGITLGVPWKKSRFTLTGELIFVLGQRTTLGDAQVVEKKVAGLVGASALLTVESMLPNGGIFYYGIGVIRAVPNFQAWVAFSDSRARYPYPRFVAGYEF